MVCIIQDPGIEKVAIRICDPLTGAYRMKNGILYSIILGNKAGKYQSSTFEGDPSLARASIGVRKRNH
jgi:hypothetical protein